MYYCTSGEGDNSEPKPSTKSGYSSLQLNNNTDRHTMTDHWKDEEDEEMPKTLEQKILKTIRRRIPITDWIRSYTKVDLVSDLIAGVTVGLTLIPQSMAYSIISGLSPEYGLYSSYLGALVYVFLGTCRQASIGPTAVMALLTFQTCGSDYPSCAILTGFYSGVFELLLAVLQLGWVVSFISTPVTVGFTSGAACTIMTSQVKNLLGMSGDKGSGFLSYWERIIKDISTIHVGDAILGITALVILILLKKLKDVKHKNTAVTTAIWLISLSRNVIVIIISSVMAFIWITPPFKLVGDVQGGFPKVSLPQFLLPVRINGTMESEEEFYGFWQTWSILKTGPMVIAVISILQNIAISKTFGSGQKVDATQEMIALGTVNVLGGFVSAIPTSASFSRSAVNEASGVRSPLGALYTGILVLLSLGFLTPTFYYIPKASLAAVIISALIFMIEYESLLPMWRISKMDAVACISTFVCSLFLGMEYGILVGVSVSTGSLLMKTLKPVITSEIKLDTETGTKYLLINPESGMTFPSVDHISSTVQKLSLKNKSCRVIVLNFTKWNTYDYTAANTLLSLVKGMKKNGKVLIFMDCDPEWAKVLKLAGLADPPVTSTEELGDYMRKNCELLTFVSFDDMINLKK